MTPRQGVGSRSIGRESGSANVIRSTSVHHMRRSGKGVPFPLTLFDGCVRKTRTLVDRQEYTVGWAVDPFPQVVGGVKW